MKVFKFGGASVKSAPAVRNLARIIETYKEPLVIVVSAMGKTTNALERMLKAYYTKTGTEIEALKEIKDYHFGIINDLFERGHEVENLVEGIFSEMESKLGHEPSMNFNFEYDQLVAYGELISTTIISGYLASVGIVAKWVDIRKVLKTNETYREANVNFELSRELALKSFKVENGVKYVTQGFIASNKNNLTTTLGREGSDYTAALLAAFIEAESVTVWKDVPGVLNADPKWFDETTKLDKLTYTDAIELAFYGASVLHPKTIQPVKQENIPLHVRSFLEPEKDGTEIGNVTYKQLIPCFIFKVNQVLIQIHPVNLSFIAEENLERIFGVLAKYSLKVNLMQNTAVSFKICVNNDETRIPKVIEELGQFYRISKESGLELITIRYYDQATISRVLEKKEVLLEQHGESTVQMVVRKVD